MDAIGPDVVALSDGGGLRKALPHPVVGADQVARVLITGLRQYGASIEPTQLNGWPALILRLDGRLDSVVALRFEHGRITGLYAVRNPDKLSRVQRPARLSR